MRDHCSVAPMPMSEPSFLEVLRRRELSVVTEVLAQAANSGAALLEIGGGAGWQAHDLAALGYKVRSVDIEDRSVAFPVELYDGHRLPFGDGSFDIVFSSNVLEHIPHVDTFHAELRRVLKPGGVGIHLMPTPTWRVATLLAHYPHLCRAAAL
jgi:2-polyprenyl-3-methyl-5-hydroxy-6-metoxy-1,4-benzoquinol methylase